MSIIYNAYCVNDNCKDFGIKNLENISIRGKFGKSKERNLLYCRTCGKRFSSSRTTAFFGLRLSDKKINRILQCTAEGSGIRATGRQLNISKDTVNRIVFKAEKQCELLLKNLLFSLKMEEDQLEILMLFIKNRKISHKIKEKT